jgi:hypothetical protein
MSTLCCAMPKCPGRHTVAAQAGRGIPENIGEEPRRNPENTAYDRLVTAITALQNSASGGLAGQSSRHRAGCLLQRRNCPGSHPKESRLIKANQACSRSIKGFSNIFILKKIKVDQGILRAFVMQTPNLFATKRDVAAPAV